MRSGVEAAYTNLVVQNERTGESQLVSLTTAPEEIRLPAGDYRVFGGVWEYVRYGRASVPERSVSVAQRVSLTGDRTLRTDVSGAKPVTMGVDDPNYFATFTVLGEYVRHNVKEEQSEMFPAARKAGLDLPAIGERMRQRKEELTEKAQA